MHAMPAPEPLIADRRRRHAPMLPLALPRVITDFIAAICSRVLLVAGEQLFMGRRGKARVVFARQVAVYLAHFTAGLTHTEAGRQFARTRATVAHSCRAIEFRRDGDPALDRLLQTMEALVRAQLRRIGPAAAHDRR